MTKITVWYADNLEDAWEKLNLCRNNPLSNFSVAHEDDYLDQPISKRIKWVEDICQRALLLSNDTKIVTNDYTFMRLLEMTLPPDKYSIYHVDEDKIFNRFVELEPNETLGLYDYLYRETVKEALKGK